MAKRFILSIMLAFVIFVMFEGVAIAAWQFLFPINIFDTSNTTRAYYPVMLGFGGQPLVDSGKIVASGNDTNMQIGSSDIKYMMSTTNVTAVVPILPSGGVVTASLYTGYTPKQTGFPIIVGSGGYVTVADNATIEPANNSTATVYGYVNTDAGNDKYLFQKAGALDVSVGATAAGNITANLYSSSLEVSINQTAIDAYENLYGGGITRAGERFTNFPRGAITRVDLQLGKNQLPTGTANLTVRRVSDDAVLGIVGNIDVSTLGAPAWVTFNTTEVVNAAPQDIRMSIEYTGGNVTNYLRCGFRNADVYAGGLKTMYSAGVWQDQAGGEATFRVYYIPPISVSAVGKSSNIYGVTVMMDTANLTLLLDGVIEGTVALGGATARNTNNDWLFMLQDTMPYCDNITISVNGLQQLYLAPTSMISGAVVPDRAGGDNDGTITWGSNSGLRITYGEMSSYEDYAATANITGGFDMPEAAMPATWFAAGESASALPFYDSFSLVAAQTGMPVQSYYFWAILGVALGAFTGIVAFTRSALMAYIAMVGVFGIGASMTIIPAWIVFVLIVFGAGIMYLYKQVAY